MSVRILDAVTIGQIAAGEIIERPASVVKELVENAVDAGARRISVSIEQGGARLVEVVDDGGGIAPEDLALAVRRHATSKLAVASDLDAIATLGFRGEGLASIAAVAQLDIFSREPRGDAGWRVRAHAESVGAPEPAAGPAGTRVRAERLFENVPVRREYLRSPAAEFGRISSWLASFALGYPHVAFALRHDGNDVWTMPATGDPRERLAMVFGREASRALLAVDQSGAHSLNGRLDGFISAPGSDRPDRRMQLLFVNGRLLRSAVMSAAWSAAYSTFTMTGRHPYGVVFLDLPPEHVDANVHPTKSDVRLRFGNQVFDAVRRAMAATLRAHAAERFLANAGSALAGVSAFAPSEVGAGSAPTLFAPESHGEPETPRMRVLEQLARTYILAADGDALLLVDQHAAHERVAYESIVAAAQQGAPSEPLLVPHVLELDAARSAALEQSLDALCAGGLEIEAFGERSFRVTATPAGYGARPFDVAGFLDDVTGEPGRRGVRERVWASLACHSVVIAGERLEFAEMTRLIERLQRCRNPMHCPHGRPTMVRIGPEEVARMFKRA
jgi:DNA mismatch repair protein MutL